MLFCYLATSSLAYAFDAGEHALIGDLAFTQSNTKIPNEIQNLEVDISFSYGQLIAMSADMYVSVEELSLNDPGLLNGFFNRNRKSLKKCINKEIDAIRKNSEYRGCDDLEFAKKKIQYVALAHDNYGHFAWHNIKKYVELHEKALWFAQLANLKCSSVELRKTPEACEKRKKKVVKLTSNSDYRKKQKSKYRRFPKLFPRKRFTQKYIIEMSKEKMVRLALFTNAFADHFLTDSFSAGHLRVPRSQIDKFVNTYDSKKKLERRQKGTSISGALTQYLHNLDGSLTGIPVTNSFGNEFIVRSDKQLFSKPNSKELSGQVEDNDQLVYPIQATKASLNELFSVIKSGASRLPENDFSALKFVPYIKNHNKDSLSMRVEAHIDKHGSIKNAIKSMSSEMQLVYRSSMVIDDISYKDYFKNFVSSIPSMMNELRVQINQEAKNKQLKKRIPNALLSALKRID